LLNDVDGQTCSPMWDPIFENDPIDPPAMCAGERRIIHVFFKVYTRSLAFLVSTTSGLSCIFPFNYDGVSHEHMRWYECNEPCVYSCEHEQHIYVCSRWTCSKIFNEWNDPDLFYSSVETFLIESIELNRNNETIPSIIEFMFDSRLV
jgi:hypothetical protein